MSRKDVTDIMVLKAYKEFGQMDLPRYKWPYEILAEWTGEHEKVCYRAMERAHKRGLVEYGTSLRTGWLTEKGKELLKSAENQEV